MSSLEYRKLQRMLGEVQVSLLLVNGLRKDMPHLMDLASATRSLLAVKQHLFLRVVAMEGELTKG